MLATDTTVIFRIERKLINGITDISVNMTDQFFTTSATATAAAATTTTTAATSTTITTTAVVIAAITMVRGVRYVFRFLVIINQVYQGASDRCCIDTDLCVCGTIQFLYQYR